MSPTQSFPTQSLIAIAWCALGLVACNASAPTVSSPTPEPTEAPMITTASVPKINTFNFDEIDIRGCGMTLRAPGSNPRTDGIYLFNGLKSANGSSEATLRMKIDDRIMAFQRTDGTGEAFYGQFNRQTFTSTDGSLTVKVNSEVTSKPENSEVWSVKGTITVINANGQETSVEAIGDAGC